MKLIVTGGAGFIGSNLILYLHEEFPDIEIFNLDKLTYASDIGYLKPLKNSLRYRFARIDLADRNALRTALQRWVPDGVIHLAAESHVDKSIQGPEPFVWSNLVGTYNILDECRQLWSETEGESSPSHRFLHVSTDEVYGSLGGEGTFDESSPYNPSSPYSATKAGSDLLVKSYYRTYGMNVVLTHCSNNFGPHQHAEKLIPTVIRKALAGESIPVYGSGENVRDWIYVGDHCRALVSAFLNGEKGARYNIGGNNEWKNIDLVHRICEILNRERGDGPDGDFANLITHVEDRPGHDWRYAIDSSRIRKELGWKPDGSFDERLAETVRWYLEH
ncbi:MAG: dTDP-glucose 4,6-dehydratase [Balneolaceae bacterium]